MVYPMRRVFHVKVWLTEVSSDDEDEPERIVICRTPSPRYSPDLHALHHPPPNIIKTEFNNTLSNNLKPDFQNMHTTHLKNDFNTMPHHTAPHNTTNMLKTNYYSSDLPDKRGLNGIVNRHSYNSGVGHNRKYLEVNNNVPSECDSSEGYETFDEMSSHLGYVSVKGCSHGGLG